MRAIRWFSFILIATSLIGCSDAKLALTSLGLVSTRFSVTQSGKETTVIKVNTALKTTTFAVNCPKGDTSLEVSFNNGTTWEKASDLDCSPGTSTVTFNLNSFASLSDKNQILISALVHGVSADEKTKDIAITLAQPTYDVGSLSALIEGGAAKTNKTLVTVAATTQQSAGTYKFKPTQIYFSTISGCTGGSWQPLTATNTGVSLGTQTNQLAYLNMKFRDEVGNDSNCFQSSIVNDNTPPDPANLSLNINNGQLITSSSSVSLQMTAGADAVKMAISNEDICTDPHTPEVWQNVAASIAPWTISGGSGINTVYAKFRDDVGNASACVSHSINYDSNPPVKPTTLTLMKPGSPPTALTSPNGVATVLIVVDAVAPGDTANLYSTSNCTGPIEASALGDTSVKASVPISFTADSNKTYFAQSAHPNGVTGACSTASVTYAYDGTAPTILNVTSNAAVPELLTGDTVLVKVNLSESVYISNTLPTLALNTSAAASFATYAGNSGPTSVLKFTYTITSSDTIDALDVSSAAALLLNGATIADAAGNNLLLTLPTGSDPNSLKSYQTTKVNYIPFIKAIRGSPDNHYFLNDRLDFIATWSNDVTVMGSPTLSISDGTTTFSANYDSYRSTPINSVFSIPVSSSFRENSAGLTVTGVSGGSIKKLSDPTQSATTTLATAASLPNVLVHPGVSPRFSFDASAGPEIVVPSSTTSISVTIKASAAPGTVTTVGYRVLDSSGAPIARYSLPNPQTVTFGPTDVSRSFSIALDSGIAMTGTQSFTLALTDIGFGRAGYPNVQRVVLQNNSYPLTPNELAVGAGHSCVSYLSSPKVSCWGMNSRGQTGVANSNTTSAVTSITLPASVSRLAAGGQSTCAIAGGKLYCWGSNAKGMLGTGFQGSSTYDLTAADAVSTPVGGSGFNFYDVQMNDSVVCAIYSYSGYSNAVSCWGSDPSNYGMLAGNTTLMPSTTPLVVNVAKVTLGATHVCTMSSDAHAVIKCWGSNAFGQLGLGSSFGSATSTPTVLPNMAHDYYWLSQQHEEVYFKDIVAGTNSTCALIDNSGLMLYCWGSGATNGSNPAVTTYALPPWGTTKLDPAPTPLRTDVTVLKAPSAAYISTPSSAGVGFICGATATDLLCWGNTASDNYLFPSSSSSIPTIVSPSPTTIGTANSSIVFGAGATTDGKNYVLCASATGGGIRCTDHKKIATDITEYPFGDQAFSRTPSSMTTPFTALSLTGTQTNNSNLCYLKSDGSLWCGGDSAYAGDGVGTSPTQPRTAPVKVIKSGVLKVSASGAATCAVLVGNTLWCWGYSDLVGNGQSTSQTLPQFIMANVGDVQVGSDSVCAITVAKELYCWGPNLSGSVGNDGTLGVPVKSPQKILDANVTAVSVGYLHVCAIKDAWLTCWGGNLHGQLGDTTTNDAKKPVDVFRIGTAVPDSISVGAQHSCAHFNNNSVRCWGYNGQYSLGNNSTADVPFPQTNSYLNGFKSVTAFGNMSCGVTADTIPLLKCWGAHATSSTTSLSDKVPTTFDSAVSSFTAWTQGITLSPTLLIKHTDTSVTAWGASAPAFNSSRGYTDVNLDFILGL